MNKINSEIYNKYKMMIKQFKFSNLIIQKYKIVKIILNKMIIKLYK